MSSNTVLDPHHPATWAALPYEAVQHLDPGSVEAAQLEAMLLRFRRLRPAVSALDKLATSQGVDDPHTIADLLPAFFDHRVYKTYPLSLLEKRQYDKLTTWLQRLTTHDLSSIPLDELHSIDDWMQRLDDHGMLIGHSTGTTGKLSFIPRSRTEWPAWQDSYFEMMRAGQGIDFRQEVLPNFSPMYRTGHQMMIKMQHLFAEASKGGEANRHVLYDYSMSSELLSMAARMQAAEAKGELDRLQIPAALLKEREEHIARSRTREHDLEQWFLRMVNEYRGQRVKLGGTQADVVKLMMRGKELGVTCDFAPGSVLMATAGMKGFKGAPDDWRDQVRAYFGIERISAAYGMSECTGTAPLCEHGYFHFFPYTVPILLDEEGQQLPKVGVQVGRMALFDLLAETYWGGFVSGDQVTMHFDGTCECGWRGPRIEDHIRRFADQEGGDDKISCAGTAQAYNDFMDYVSTI